MSRRAVHTYRLTGSTPNVRALATADALLYEGNVVKPFSDKTTHRALLSHVFAGVKARLCPTEWLDEPVPILERFERANHTTLVDGNRNV